MDFRIEKLDINNYSFFDDMVFYLTPSTLKCDDDNVFEHYIDTMMSDLQKIGAVKLRYHGMID